MELPGGLTAEADQYSGSLDGVSVVEVEFESEADAVRFEPPHWFGRELTGDLAWANQRLALAGVPDKKVEFRLRPGEGPAAGLARVVAARTAQAAAAVRRAGRSDDPAPHVHEARKSTKKARSALRLLRGVISDDERAGANAALRRASAALSGARDAEVKIATLETIGLEPEPYGVTVWKIHLEGEADSHRGELTGERLARVAGEIEVVGQGYRGRGLGEGGAEVAANAARAYRQGRKAMKRARKSDEAEAFHDWRKRTKDLRYQLEMLSALLPESFDKTRVGAEELAERLGDLHDLDVLAGDLEGRDMDPVHKQAARDAIREARDGLARECLSEGAGVYDLKPERFERSLAEALGR